MTKEDRMRQKTHPTPAQTPEPQAGKEKLTHTQQTCKCKNGKFHKSRGFLKGRKCGAPTLGAKDGLCSWCRKGHPDHSHHAG